MTHNMTINSRDTCARQSGLSLIEVLVAIVIISFGLLGVAALQVTGLKNNQSAYLRSTATVLAYDMLDRMRTNKKALIAGDYNTGGAFWNYADNAPTSTTTMKDADLKDWLQILDKQLPSGKAKIEASANATTLRISIQWDDTRGTNKSGSETKTLTIEAQGCGSSAATDCYL